MPIRKTRHLGGLNFKSSYCISKSHRLSISCSLVRELEVIQYHWRKTDNKYSYRQYDNQYLHQYVSVFFNIYGVSHLRRQRTIFAYQTKTRYLNQRLIYYYIRFLKANGCRTEILLPVSIFSPPSACDSALAYQILSKFDDHRRIYDYRFSKKAAIAS